MTHPPTEIAETPIRCVKCGYDLSGTTIGGLCPECGVTVEESLRPRQVERTSGKAIASLVLGLVSLSACFLAGPVAICLSLAARHEMRSGCYTRGSRSMATAGLVLGIISTTLVAAWISIAVATSWVRASPARECFTQ